MKERCGSSKPERKDAVGWVTGSAGVPLAPNKPQLAPACLQKGIMMSVEKRRNKYLSYQATVCESAWVDMNGR